MRSFLVAIVVAITTATTAAAPARRPSAAPALAEAEAAWRAAEIAPRLDAAAAWERAAEAFAAVATSTTAADAERADAAWAEVLAWANARRLRIRAARGQPPVDEQARDRGQLAALDRALPLLPAAGPERASALSWRAELRARLGDPDGAIADLADVVDHHRDDDVAPFAALRLLDALAGRGRPDALAARVVALRADATFRARTPELAETLDALAFLVVRDEAEALTTAGDRACHDRYLAAAAIDPGRPDAIEVRIDAALCLAATGDVDAALADLVDGRALRRAAVALARRTGRYAAAAALAVRDVDADGDRAVAVELLATVGRLDEADRLAAPFRRRAVAGSAPALVTLAGAHLALGQRQQARTWLAAARSALGPDWVPQVGPRIPTEPDARARFAQLAWQASCDVDAGDGLCPTRRQRTIAGVSLAALAAEVAPVTAARRVLDLQAEQRPAASGDGGLTASYRALLAPAEGTPGEAMIVRARLAALAARAGDTATASVHYQACVALATAAPSRLALCDASVARLGLVPPPLRERLPVPASAPLAGVRAP